MPTIIRVSDLAAGLARGLGRLLEERVYGDLRIAFNDQPFLLGSGFTLSTLRFWFLRHFVLLSHWLIPSEEKVVPRMGFGPISHKMARGCKPRLYANSSTEARSKALNAGAVTPVTVSPVPALFRPFSAALNPSSLVLLPLSAFSFSERAKNIHDRSEQINLFEGEVQRKLNKGIRQPWYGHSIKTLGSHDLSWRILCASRLAGFICLIGCRSRHSRLCLQEVWGYSNPALREYLEVETYCLSHHLARWDTVALEGFLQIGNRSSGDVDFSDYRGIFVRNDLKEPPLERGRVVPSFHELPINISSSSLLIHTTQKSKARNKRSMISPREIKSRTRRSSGPVGTVDSANVSELSI